MNQEANPKIHGPITPEQADAIANADTKAAGELLKQAGIENPGSNDVIAVEGGKETAAYYVSASPEDAGTRVLSQTVQEQGLPPLDQPAVGGREPGAVSKRHEPIVVSQPGDPGHEAKVAEWQRNQAMIQAAAEEMRNRSNG